MNEKTIEEIGRVDTCMTQEYRMGEMRLVRKNLNEVRDHPAGSRRK